MKDSKRGLMVIICLLLTLSMLVSACGKSDTASGDTSASSSSTDQTAVPTQAISKIKLMGPSKLPKYAKFEDREKFASWKLFEEELKKRNIELSIEWIVPEQYPTVVQTRMAAALDLPDLVNISPLDELTAVSLGTQGTIIDVNEAIAKYSNGELEKKFTEGKLEFAKRLTTAPDGKRYWFCNSIASPDVALDNGNIVPNLQVINNCIRKDWLDKLNLPMPTTVDEWKNALHAFRENDMNGNKVKDEALLLDAYSYSFFTGIAQWFGLVPDVVAIDPVTDKAVSPWYQPGVKEYFKLLRDMAKDGTLDTGMIGATDEACNQRIAENKVSSLRSYAIAGWFEDLITSDKNAEYAILPPLKTIEGVTPLMLTDSADLAFDKYAITKACKDVEAVIRLLDYVCTVEYGWVATAGIEGADYIIEKDPITGKDVAVAIDKTKPSDEEKYGKTIGGMSVFVGNVLPRFFGKKPNPDKAQTLVDGLQLPKAKVGESRRLALIEYTPYVTSPFSSNKYSLPSNEEVEITNKYFTSLKTRSEELAMALILGNASIDDWDKHIKELQTLGLDEMIKVYQSRYDRYVSAK